MADTIYLEAKGKLVGRDEWVVGSFLPDVITGKKYIASMLNGNITSHEVQEKSIQQSIDKYDEDGNEIFINDIIRIFANGCSFDGIVRYGDYTQKGRPYKTRTGLYVEWYEDSVLGQQSSLEDVLLEVDSQYDNWVLVLGNTIDNHLCDFDSIEIVPNRLKGK